MGTAAIAIVLVTVGVHFGWEPTKEGPAGYEYTVQIEPEIADLLQRGDQVPIESNVPPGVAPIRKVRIVVGRGELARTPLAADADKLQKYVARSSDAIVYGTDNTHSDRGALTVRGQDPDSLPDTSRRHTVAYPPPHTPLYTPPPANVAVERYGNPVPSSATAVVPPPGTRSAVPTTAPSSSAISPPPWPPALTPSVSPSPTVIGGPVTHTATGWTSIGGNIAAPPLLPSSLSTIPTGSAYPMNAGMTVASNPTPGPAFPAPTMVPVRPVAPTTPVSQPTTSSWSDPWDTDPWNQPPQSSPAAAASQPNQVSSGAIAVASPSPVDWGNTAIGTPSAPPPAQGAFPSAVAQPGQPVFGSATPNMPLVNPPANSSPSNGSTTAVPWTSLIFTGLGLIGSLGANLFLGWSYMDARQRYQTLARKTAHSFRRRSEAIA